MELFESIKSRKSIRAFKDAPVSDQLLMELLEVSTLSPSGFNLQPWEFFVVRGKQLKELKQASLEEHRLGKKPNPEIPMGPAKGLAPIVKGIFRERQVELGKQIFQIMGITKDDKTGPEKWNERLVQFYDAPTAIILVVDKMLEDIWPWPVLDIGLVVGYITLVAQEYGLGTCIMRGIIDHPQKIREIVGVPESKHIIIGIAIGYPDRDNPINNLKTNRERIEKIVTLVG